MPKDLKQHYGMLLIAEYAWEDEYQEWLRENAKNKAAEIAQNSENHNDEIVVNAVNKKADTKRR